MDKSMLILALISASTCLAAIVLCVILASKKRSGDSDSSALASKVDSLAASFSSEMSNNRMENERKLSELRDKMQSMSEKNSQSLFDISEKINRSLSEIRDLNAAQSEKTMKTFESSIEKMIAGNEKKLEEMRVTVDEKLNSTLTSRLDSSFKTVSGQLEKLYVSLGEMKELSGGITANVTSLNRVLTNVKARGTWAEYQLEAILDQTIPNMYIKNFKPSSCNDFVEFAIKIPSSEDSSQITYLPVDSKFPMEDYARLCSAADAADADAVEKARKALEKRVTDEAKTVAKYINVPETTPFAIMYLATEGLYAEIASSKLGLLEKLQSEYSIMIAGPATITALLNTIAMGFRSIAINEKANEIRELLGAVKKQYDTFDGILGKVKKKIEEADKQIDEATRRNRLIQKKLRSVEETDSTTADNLLGIGDSDSLIEE